jgi:hypothetical protein
MIKHNKKNQLSSWRQRVRSSVHSLVSKRGKNQYTDITSSHCHDADNGTKSGRKPFIMRKMQYACTGRKSLTLISILLNGHSSWVHSTWRPVGMKIR